MVTGVCNSGTSFTPGRQEAESEIQEVERDPSSGSYFLQAGPNP